MHAFAALHGGWDAVYAPGLAEPATISRSSDAAAIDTVLTRVERGDAGILAIHATRLGTLDPAVPGADRGDLAGARTPTRPGS